MVRRMVKYNPSFLTEDELVNNFVVRHTDLELIMRVISENTTGSNQHVLVIGPRGSGKTTLALRVAAEIERDAGLREKWYPLVFSEESYRATSAADFWLEALFHLAEQTGEEKWLRAYQEMRDELDDKRLADRPLWQLLDFADSQGKRILLIVENLHMLFADLASDDEAWKMRHTLINEPRLMLLATATTRFEDVENPSQAMFEMFKMHELKPLEDEECNTIWELVAGAKLPGNQIRPIRILTGGNARLLAIIARFGAHRSFRQLLDDLVDLIDDHTDYFKSRIDHMPSTERKVYLSLAELWKPSTAREIARVARLDVNKTSSLLNRLAGRGDVVVESRNKKTKWYRLAEGIYNIYYLMRRRGRAADRVKATVTFMIAMYGHESATRMLAEEACGLSLELCREHYIAYGEIIKSVRDRRLIDRIIASTPRGFLESPYFDEFLRSFMTTEKTNGEGKDLPINEEDELEEARKLNGEGRKFGREGNFGQALAMFEQLIAKFGNSDRFPYMHEVARALINKGVTLGRFGRFEEGIAAYDEVVWRYDVREEKELVEIVAGALINKGVTLGRLGRFEEGIAAYDEVTQRYGGREEKKLAEIVAGALFNKGVTLGRLDRFEEEIAAYGEVTQRYGGRQEKELAEQVAKALVNKGLTLGSLDRFEEEIAAYDEVTQQYGGRVEKELAEQVARALVYKGITLGRLGRFEEEIATYDEVVQQYGSREEKELAEQVAKALVNKGVTLGRLARFEEGIAAYEEVIRRYGGREEKELAEQVAKALTIKGLTLGRLDRFEEEIAAYEEVIRRYGVREENELAEQVANALVNKGITLGSLDRFEEEIAVYEEVVRRYGGREEKKLAEQVANALVNKGITLGMLDRPDEAIAVDDEVVRRYGVREEKELAEQVANALVNKGITLGMLDRSEDEIAVYEEVVWRYGGREEKELAEQVANAHLFKGIVFCRLGKGDEALESARKYLQDPAVVEKTMDDAIELFVGLAACNQAKTGLELLVNSPAEKHLEPLIVGLKLFMGEEVQTAMEILEVAKDVVKKIEEQKQLQQAATTR